jgi:hypothetical protein
MRVLAANLKHLYQRRALWLVYLFLALPMVGMVVGAASARRSAAPTLLLFLFTFLAVIGLLFGTCQREVASRPFAFLLPRHTGIAPRQALIQGALVAAVAPLCWLVLPRSAMGQHPGLLGAIWLLGTACYMAGSVLGFVLPFVAPTLASLPLVIFASSFLAPAQALNLAVQEYPALVGTLALGLIAWSWRYLGRRALARRWAGLRTLTFADEFNMAKAAQYHQWRKANRGSRQSELGDPALAHSCIEGIRHSRPEGMLRYWHAVRYEWLGASTGKGLLKGVVFGTIFVLLMGYVAGGRKSIILFIMPATMAIPLRRVHATTLLPIGRRQRHVLAVIGVLLLTALSACMMWPLVALSHAIAPSMPSLTLRHATLSFQPFPYLYALIPIIVIPLAVAVLTWLKKRTAVVMLVGMALFPAVVLLAQTGWHMPLAVWGTLPFVSMLASLWALRYHCLHRDIV